MKTKRISAGIGAMIISGFMLPTFAAAGNAVDGNVAGSNGHENGRIVVIKASYDSGRLMSSESYKTTAEAIDELLRGVELSIGVKLFIWDPLDGIKPYREPLNADGDIEVMSDIWRGKEVILTRNPSSGETKVWQTIIGTQKVELRADTFAYDDTGYEYGEKLTINNIAVYKDRVYAGCDGGSVIVFTECSKCYQLRKVCDFDIKTMEITNGFMTVSDGINEKVIDMTDIGSDSIEAGEALELYAKGARLIDVRTAEEFQEKSYAGSLNIPLGGLEAALDGYDVDDVLIFYCASGIRASQAVAAAKALGFTNVYNLGSIDKLL